MTMHCPPDTPDTLLRPAAAVQVVCDLTYHAGRTLFVWNQKDERRMKHV